MTRVRNAMHGNILRKSTKKLQDDLRQTMRTYSSEKQQLLKQLANLRHEIDDMKISDGSISPSTFSDFSQRTSRSNKSRYFHAPDIAAQKAGKNSQKKEGNLTDRSSISSTRVATKDLTKDEILKLPAIPGLAGNNKPKQNLNSNSNSSIWYSGKNLVEKNNNVPEAAKNSDSSKNAEMLKDNYQIPKISDPMRNDITLSKSKTKDKKKVHFANVQSEKTVKNYYAQSADQLAKENHSKNLKNGEAENLPHIPTKISRKNNHKGHKKFRAFDKSHGKLPPIDEVKLGTYHYESQQAAENYKAMYVSITNPEERMKTLADILYAVRLRMQENEQNLQYGKSPRYGKTENTLCDFLLKNNQENNKSPDNGTSPVSDVSKVTLYNINILCVSQCVCCVCVLDVCGQKYFPFHLM